MGDAEATLAAAIGSLAALPGVRVRGVSRLYRTSPVGVADQPDFRNAAVALEVPSGPEPATGATTLLAALKGLERAFGRRERERWGPRELDLDLLLFGRSRVNVSRPPGTAPNDPAKSGAPLTIPHPEAQHRLFVLAPLADLAPGLAPPGWGETVRTARARQERVEGTDAVRPVGRWDPRRSGWVDG